MKTILIVIVGVLAIVAGGLGYLGFFNPIEVQEREAGPFQFVYAQEPGKDTVPPELTEALDQRLGQAGYDNRRPAQVEYPDGRNIQDQIGFIVDRAATPEVLDINSVYRQIEAQRYMSARFPFRMPLSLAVGKLRVESAFGDHREEKGYADTSVIVIKEKDSIVYLQPIEKG